LKVVDKQVDTAFATSQKEGALGDKGLRQLAIDV
jgi:hypothetical protein